MSPGTRWPVPLQNLVRGLQLARPTEPQLGLQERRYATNPVRGLTDSYGSLASSHQSADFTSTRRPAPVSQFRERGCR